MSTLRTALPLSPFGCAEHLGVERLLRGEFGVREVIVNPETEMAYVEYDPLRTVPEVLLGRLHRAGYAPADREGGRHPRPTADRGG